MIAVSCITDNGLETARKLTGLLPGTDLVDLRGKGLLRPWVDGHFHDYTGHIFIMSLGIVYRMIAGHITNKYDDPAVVVVDDARRYAVAALSGHEGGANELAWKTAALLDCEPVISTASDTNKRIVLGVGCRRGVAKREVVEAVQKALEQVEVTPEQVRIAGSVDIKRDESGLVDGFGELGLPLVFLDSGRLRQFCGSMSESDTARRHLDLPGVSEPCALILGRRSRLVLPRTVYGRVTVAVAREDES